jgi:uncharacterized membrane protein
MHPTDFLKQLDDEKIVAAIAEAERGTSGEIRVFISHRARPDALAAARIRFRKLGMHRTRHRNAVLLYLSPRTRSFAIFGDTGVHEKCGDDFWKKTAAQFSGDIGSLPMNEAVIRAVRTLGGVLAEHFPAQQGDPDELPNRIERED